MSHAPLRIYDGGLCGTPCSVSLLCTKEMEMESIEESSRRLWRLCPYIPSNLPLALITLDRDCHVHTQLSKVSIPPGSERRMFTMDWQCQWVFCKLGEEGVSRESSSRYSSS
jgi:hypothetical protein